MATDPRDALNRLVAALEHHFDVAQAGEQTDARSLEDAEERLRDAFFTYDDELFTTHGVELPFDLVEDEDLEDEDFPEDEDDADDDTEDVDEDDFDADDTEITDVEAD